MNSFAKIWVCVIFHTRLISSKKIFTQIYRALYKDAILAPLLRSSMQYCHRKVTQSVNVFCYESKKVITGVELRHIMQGLFASYSKNSKDKSSFDLRDSLSGHDF